MTIETESNATAMPSGAVWVCPQALLAPVRVERSGSTLVFASTTNNGVVRIVWPSRFSAQLVDDQARLLARDGTVIAREGDVLGRLGGGGYGDAFHVCSVNGVVYVP